MKIKHLSLLKLSLEVALIFALMITFKSEILPEKSTVSAKEINTVSVSELEPVNVTAGVSAFNTLELAKETVDIQENESVIVTSAEPDPTDTEIQQSVIIEEEPDLATMAYAVENFNSPYEGYITRYMDLNNRTDISTDQMNQLIDYWLDKNGTTDSELKNMGQAYIDASKLTGYDPIFLLSLTAAESGWDVSYLHSIKNNPYSINMHDLNPNDGYILGETFYDGIIAGAIWINENYYNNGLCTLHDMIYGGRLYATARDTWINHIVSIMDESYRVLNIN